MVWNTLKNAIGLGGEPTLDDDDGQPTRLPQYFPVEPKGCEKHSQNLFQCLANEATAKARDMERVGYHRPYFHDVTPVPTDPKAAEAVAADPTNPDYPKPNDNPLDECKKLIAYYKHCCDRKLKLKKNWILTESVRVQEEYRYQGPEKDNVTAATAATTASNK
ncbi:hypothetical protein IV203_033329 [Nitzschia inconspicua]|uniref:Uncharacterized protein n=1 Tax=Nitzschia inconspicua TaxID=303405 RepID=A0A9K3KMY1_9STRA|nr:hypothetical protein IV203_033329 [Nitzschia inconspicua]